MTLNLLRYRFSLTGPAQSNGIPLGFNMIPIGAGGFLTGLSVTSDGSIAVRTDTYGGYIWNPTATDPIGRTTGSWQQIVNANSMPGSYNWIGNGNSGPCYDLQLAYSNSSIGYMVYNDVTAVYPNNYTVYKSVNKGGTWTATGFTPIYFDTAYDGAGFGSIVAHKNWAKLAVDPTNPNFIVVGSNQNGLFYSNNGGTSWSNPAGVPVSTLNGTRYPGVTVCIGFYSGTQYIFAWSYGNGIYKSTNGGTSWTLINSGVGANTSTNWAFDSLTGYVYCVDFSGNIWQYTASAGTPAWTQATQPSLARDVACDPNLANHLVIVDGSGKVSESTNGTTFGSYTQHNQTGQPITTGDIPWMTLFNGCNADRVSFNPTIPSPYTIFGASDRDFLVTSWTGALSNAVNISWTSQARGIEQLVTNCVIVPNSAKPIIGIWDSGLFAQLNLSVYPPPTNSWPNTVAVNECESLDYAYNNFNFIAALVDGGAGNDSNNPDISAFSSDGGNTWTRLATPPPGANVGGNIAASTNTNVMFAPAASGVVGHQPYFTTNFSASPTWTGSTLPSNQTSWTNFHIPVNAHGGRYVAADKAVANTFYLLFPNGTNGAEIYQSNNNGSTWGNSIVTFVGASTGTSTTNNTIPLVVTGTSANNNTIPGSTGGSFTWTTNTAFGLPNGTTVTAQQTSNSSNFITGTVTDNTGTNLTLTCTAFGGSGAISAWTFNFFFTFTTNTSFGLSNGSTVIAYQTGSPGNYIKGTVSSDTGTSLVIACNEFRGSGVGITAWTFTTQSYNYTVGVWMKTTPGVANDFWVLQTGIGSPHTALYHWANGTLYGMTNVIAAYNLGFGINAGGGYPSVYFAGQEGIVYNTNFAIWRSDNAGATATPTWNFLTATPNGSYDHIADISGDPVIPLQWYVCFSGSGAAYYKAV